MGKSSVSSNIKVENIVATVDLKVHVPLDRLVANLQGTEYEPEQFPGLVYRIKEPKAAALIFTSGKIVCTGTRSIQSLRKAIDKITAGLRVAGIKIPDKVGIKVENIVASAKLPGRLILDTMAFSLPNAEYEPERFPGVVYRIKKPKTSFLLFGTGKIICTGGKTTKDIEYAIGLLHEKLDEIGAIKKEEEKEEEAAEAEGEGKKG